MKKLIVLFCAFSALLVGFSANAFAAGPPAAPVGSYNAVMSMGMNGNKIGFVDCSTIDKQFTAHVCTSPDEIGKFVVKHRKLAFVPQKGVKEIAGGFVYCPKKVSAPCVIFSAWNAQARLPLTQRFGGVAYYLNSAAVELKQ